MKKLLFLPLLLLCASLHASNLKITGGKATAFYTNSVELTFNISQENTISTFTASTPHERVTDCVWIFVKYSTCGVSGPWNHATIYADTAGDAPGATKASTSDYKGVFITANQNMSYWSDNNVKVRWCSQLDGITTLPSQMQFRVMGIEMVYISTGSFIYNVNGVGTDTYNNYGHGSQVTVDSIDDVPAGCDTAWPNGYRAFFCAKYEVSQKQYADYLNTIDPNGSSGTEYYYASAYGNWEYYIKRDISRPAGDKYYVTNGGEDLACSFGDWNDWCRYASWSGLRPMTEMEFERAARGSNVSWRFPWGNQVPSQAIVNSTETKTGTGFDCWLNYANFFDNGDNIQNADGPTPVGHYLSGLNISGASVSRTPEQTGASQYGISDLGGNLWDQVIRCDYLTTPFNGNGTINYPESWPVGDSGRGYRGGSWYFSYDAAAVSDRQFVFQNSWRDKAFGFHPVRTP